MEPEPAKTECGKYTLLIGLVKVADEYLTEASRGCDLTSIKESVMHKVLNINNYIKSLCDYYAREKRTGKPYYAKYQREQGKMMTRRPRLQRPTRRSSTQQ